MPSELHARNMYQVYMTAWKRGALIDDVILELAQHRRDDVRDMWTRGYTDGLAARIRASNEVSQLVGYCCG